MFARDKMAVLSGAYQDAAKAFKTAEATLDRALDALAAAREGDNPGDITRTRLAATEADIAARVAWSDVEVARRAFWVKRAAEQEARVVGECLPLLVQLAAYQRFGGLPSVAPDIVLRHHLITAQAHVEPDGDVPIDPLPAAALDRADDEIVVRGV